MVDDDARIQQMLFRYLEGEGCRVTCADDGKDMHAKLSRQRFDMILLDLVLPGQDGLDILRELRSTSDIPVIMLTGRDDVVDRVVGLEFGADDYIAKPFHLREVYARIKTILRRRPSGPSASSSAPEVVTFDGWRLDKARRQLVNGEGIEIELTTGEFDMLDVFVAHAGRVLSRDLLMDLTRNRTLEAFDRTIDSQIVRLRKKIEANPSKPQLIKSVRGVGYVFTAKPEPVFA